MARTAPSAIVGIVTLLYAGVLQAADWWLTATLTSYHFDRRGYNEKNYGLGAEYHWDETYRGGFGFYENSYYRRTYYLMAQWLPIHSGNWHTGMSVGLVSGYEKNAVVVPIPTVAYENDKVGVNLGITPAFIGVQIKFRLD